MNHVLINNLHLVGDIPTPLKNMTSSVGVMTFPTEWSHKKYSKPPTSQALLAKSTPDSFQILLAPGPPGPESPLGRSRLSMILAGWQQGLGF